MNNACNKAEQGNPSCSDLFIDAASFQNGEDYIFRNRNVYCIMAEEKLEAPVKDSVFLSPECPVKKVTVFSDRAEVCRQIVVSVTAGVNNVIFKHLPASIDQDSIRVEGTGAATIAEVSYQSRHESQDEAELSGQERELEQKLCDLNKEKEHMAARMDVLAKQWKLLDNFGDTVSTTAKNNPVALDQKYFSGVTSFLNLYNEEGGKLETSRLKLKEDLEKMEEKISAAELNLSKLRGNRDNQKESRECVIVLESEGESEVTLLVSYVVSEAAWTPSYDIRMFTAEGVLKIQYYGQITQSTGEDWTDAKLFLSTASPSIGGTVPELPVAVLSIKQHTGKKSRRILKSFSLRQTSFESYNSHVQQEDKNNRLSSAGLVEGVAKSSPPEPMLHVETEVTELTTSTSYEIARQSSVPSDNMPHKVSVGIFNVKPTLEYVTVPKVAPRAFLRAKVINDSVFSLLPGATSIFLDNSFVAKAELKAVSPGEEFECSLGIDPAVRVTYKPVKKYKESSGLISKIISTTYEQPIEIKNTHDYPIKIELKEQLPRSTDEKIKVAIVEPALDMKHHDKNKNPMINKHNHVVWDLDLEKQETREITLIYTVDHPANEVLITSDCFEGDA